MTDKLMWHGRPAYPDDSLMTGEQVKHSWKWKGNSEQHRRTDCNRKMTTLACFEEGEEAEGADGNSKYLVFRKRFEFAC